MTKTTIQIEESTWSRLLYHKCRPSQTFDEIINHALDIMEAVE